MKAIAQERRRFGYRPLLVMLRREGLVVNHKKLFRALSGEARRSPPWRPQAGDRDQSADAGTARGPTSAGRLTSYRTSSPTGPASAS